MYEVYLITNEVNGKQYVGKTIHTAKHRWYGHRRGAKDGINSRLCKAIKKYGEDKFKIIVLYQGSSDREILSVERAMIAQYRTLTPNGYNICIGGEGTSGRRMSEENKSAISLRMIGNTLGHVLKGRKHTPEQVAANSAAQKKIVISSETRNKMAASMRGKKRPHVGPKISAAKKGQLYPNCRAVICITKDTIYRSIQASAEDFGMSYGGIKWALSNPDRSAGGHKFVYAVA